MAQRRLFSKKIIYDDIFSTLPNSAKILYFIMNLEADDDGFVSSMKRVMSYAGVNRKSLDLLKENGLVIEFSGGVCVIVHWFIHNTIPKDRYTPTMFAHYRKNLILTTNGSYMRNPVGGK